MAKELSHNNLDVKLELKQLPQTVKALHAQDEATQLEAASMIRKLTASDDGEDGLVIDVDSIIEAGAVPHLVHLLNHPNREIQAEAAWALSNITAGTSEHTNVVIGHGSVPLFVTLLDSPSDDVKEHSVRALGNIASDFDTGRDLVLHAGALEPLLPLCKNTDNIEMARSANWTLTNLCGGDVSSVFKLVKDALPAFAHILRHCHDEEVLHCACAALLRLSKDNTPDDSQIEAVVQSGVGSELIQLLTHPNHDILSCALRTIGNIMAGNDQQAETIPCYEVLPRLLELLGHDNENIRMGACWTLSNIAAGSVSQIEAVLDTNVLPSLLPLLSTNDFDIVKEAIWTFANVVSNGTDEQIHRLVEVGAVPPLCELLSFQDPQVAAVALQTIGNILILGQHEASLSGGVNRYAEFVEQAGGVDKLKALYRHEVEVVCDKAAEIFETYFAVPDEEST